MKTIISKQNIPILVDDEDFDLVSKYEWSVYDRYADSYVNGKTTKMHRLILGIENTNIHIDHKNGVTTDNRKENLRICNRFENQQNRKINKNNKVGHKGINILPNGNFRVRVQSFGKRFEVGVFSDLEEAINERDKFAKEKHGEFFR